MAIRTSSRLHERFAPHAALAADLLPHAMALGRDAGHDVTHLCRVWSLGMRISAVEGGDRQIIAAAVLLHDCVAVPKSSSRRAWASRLSGRKAGRILAGMGWDRDRIGGVVHAIEAHSFSAGIEPRTIEAMILQDADRLDALGAVGVARCFMVAGGLGRPFYDEADPGAHERPPDDAAWTLDHFPAKLLRLRDSLLTREGMRIGEVRHGRIARTYADLLDEIGVTEAD